jgi:hypothetical protein
MGSLKNRQDNNLVVELPECNYDVLRSERPQVRRIIGGEHARANIPALAKRQNSLSRAAAPCGRESLDLLQGLIRDGQLTH